MAEGTGMIELVHTTTTFKQLGFFTGPVGYLKAKVFEIHSLECCRYLGVKHLVFASSSSVYGANSKIPFSVHNNLEYQAS